MLKHALNDDSWASISLIELEREGVSYTIDTVEALLCDQPELALTWYQGTHKPPAWTRGTIPRWSSGVLFVGDQGQLLSDYGKHVLLPESKFRDFVRPTQSIPPSRGHHAEWIHACKTGEPTTCNFEYAGWLTEANHLGNVAYRVGKPLQWNAETMTVTNIKDAERFVRRDYRKGWSLA